MHSLIVPNPPCVITSALRFSSASCGRYGATEDVRVRIASSLYLRGLPVVLQDALDAGLIPYRRHDRTLHAIDRVVTMALSNSNVHRIRRSSPPELSLFQ